MTSRHSPSQGSLWLGMHTLPCVSRAQGEHEKERWQSWTFRLSLPLEVHVRERFSHGKDRPLLALFITPIPRGQEVASLHADLGSPQDIVTSFVDRRRLCAVVEPLLTTTEIRVTVRWQPRSAEPRPCVALPTKKADRAALRLRRFGHSFLLEHKRLPTLVEVAARLGLTPAQAEQLATRTHAPLGDEPVEPGSLPRMRIAGDSESWASERGASLHDFGVPVAPGKAGRLLSQLDQDLDDFALLKPGPRGGKIRVRPISASALRKLRRPVSPKGPGGGAP